MNRTPGIDTVFSKPYITRRGLLTAVAQATALGAAPARAAIASLGFVVIGDWGIKGAQRQKKVAEQMAKKAEAIGGEFVLSLGDNFYPDGVRSKEDDHWKKSFEEIYTADSLKKPWYGVFGNHDYRDSIEAQLNYKSPNKDRWRLSKRYDVLRPEPRSDGTTIDFFLLDTNPFIPRWDDDHVKFDGKNSESDTAPIKRLLVKNQLEWLNLELSRSKANWKIVVGHHQIYSAGGAHPDFLEMQEPLPGMRASLPGLFKKYRVQAYLNGHQHNLAHVEKDGIHYITCGAGHETLGRSYSYPARFSTALAADNLRLAGKSWTPERQCKDDSQDTNDPDSQKLVTSELTLANCESGAFMAITISQKELDFEFIDDDGSHLYHYRINR